MKKTTTIALQQDLILSTLDALKVLAVTIASGSQDDAFKAVAQIGLKSSYIAAAIAEGNEAEAVASFAMTQDDIIAEAKAREAAEGGCPGCTTEGPDLSREDLEGILDTLQGMMGDLGINVSR